MREQIKDALSNAGAFCGDCGFEPGDRGCPDCERCYEGYADAVANIALQHRDELADAAREYYDRALTYRAAWYSARRRARRYNKKLQQQ